MLSIQSVMTRDVLTVNPKTPIFDALNLLAKENISGLPVVDQSNHVVGILTEKDVLSILLQENLTGRNKVEDFMSQNVVTFNENDDALEICKFFIKSHIRRVPITKDNKLVGIISRHDLVSLILEAKSKISDMRYD